jgi:hypothetical protein
MLKRHRAIEAYGDLELFFIEKMGLLIRDVRWRCEELEIPPGVFSLLLIDGLLRMLLRIVAEVTPPGGDKEFLRLVERNLRRARHEKTHEDNE